MTARLVEELASGAGELFDRAETWGLSHQEAQDMRMKTAEALLALQEVLNWFPELKPRQKLLVVPVFAGLLAACGKAGSTPTPGPELTPTAIVRPTDILKPTIEMRTPTPTETPAPEPTPTQKVEQIYLIPGIIYPEEFGKETIQGFLTRGDNNYYRPAEEGPESEAYIKKVYEFLLVNSEVLEPLLSVTESSRGETLGEMSAVLDKSVGEIISENKDSASWREWIVSHLASFKVFSGTSAALQLKVPWPTQAIGGGEFNPLPEKKEIQTQIVQVGETAKYKNPIFMEVMTQEGKEISAQTKNSIAIILKIHPQENTGFLREDKTGPGWGTLVRQWFIDHPEEWQGIDIAFIEVNPDGQGRMNPNDVDVNRNFDCDSCAWEKTDPKTRAYSDPDGSSPMSEPESQALIKAVEILNSRGRVLFNVILHDAVPPDGAIDPGHCEEKDLSLSCAISKIIAELSGADYVEIWVNGADPNNPEGLAGQPADYFSEKGVPTADFEFSQRKPSAAETENFCQALTKAVNDTYKSQ